MNYPSFEACEPRTGAENQTIAVFFLTQPQVSWYKPNWLARAFLQGELTQVWEERDTHQN